jgi:hypothetical protein
VFNKGKKNEKSIKVELFPWEKLDLVDAFKKAFALNNNALKKETAASSKKTTEAPKSKSAAAAKAPVKKSKAKA